MAEFNPLDYGEPVEASESFFNPLDYGEPVDTALVEVEQNVAPVTATTEEPKLYPIPEREVAAPEEPILYPIPERQQGVIAPAEFPREEEISIAGQESLSLLEKAKGIGPSKKRINTDTNMVPYESDVPTDPNNINLLNPNIIDHRQKSIDVDLNKMGVINPQKSVLEEDVKWLKAEKAKLDSLKPVTNEEINAGNARITEYNKRFNSYKTKTKKFEQSVKAHNKNVDELNITKWLDEKIKTNTTEPNFINRVTDKFKQITKLEPKLKDSKISSVAAAQSVIELLAKEEGIPVSEYRQAPKVIEQAAQGFTDAVTWGVPSAIKQTLTGEKAASPEGTLDTIGFALGSLGGLVMGPFKAAERVISPIGKLAGRGSQNGKTITNVLKEIVHDGALLGVGSGVSQTGEALEKTTFTDAAKHIQDSVQSGTLTGVVFGMSKGLFPKEGWQKGARLITGLTALNAQRAYEIGGNPFTDRAVGEVIFDIGLDAVFLWKGLPKDSKAFVDLDRLSKNQPKENATIQEKKQYQIEVDSWAKEVKSEIETTETKWDPVAEFSDGTGEVKAVKVAEKPEVPTKTRLKNPADEVPIVAKVKELGSLEKVKRLYNIDDDVSRFARETAAELFGGDANIRALTPKLRKTPITSGYEVQVNGIDRDGNDVKYEKEWIAKRDAKIAARKAGANITEYDFNGSDKDGWTFQRRKVEAPEKVETNVEKKEEVPETKLPETKEPAQVEEIPVEEETPEQKDYSSVVKEFNKKYPELKLAYEGEFSGGEQFTPQGTEYAGKTFIVKDAVSVDSLLKKFKEVSKWDGEKTFGPTPKVTKLSIEDANKLALEKAKKARAEREETSIEIEEIPVGEETPKKTAKLAPVETPIQVLGKPGYKKGAIVPWKMESYAKKAAEKKEGNWEAVEREDGWVIEEREVGKKVEPEKSKIDVDAVEREKFTPASSTSDEKVKRSKDENLSEYSNNKLKYVKLYNEKTRLAEQLHDRTKTVAEHNKIVNAVNAVEKKLDSLYSVQKAMFPSLWSFDFGLFHQNLMFSKDVPGEQTDIALKKETKLKPSVPPSKKGKLKKQPAIKDKEKEVTKVTKEKPFKKKAYPEKEYDKALSETYAKQAKKAYANGELEATEYMAVLDLITKKDLESVKKVLELINPSSSPNLADKIIKGKGGADLKRLISMLGSQMYKGNLAEVTIKEVVQNSFDAVKASVNQGKVEDGRIVILTDPISRIIAIKDNGQGMSKDVILNAFLTVAGTSKEGLGKGQASGGFGMAKAAFLYGNEWISVNTVKNGKRYRFKASGDELLSKEIDITESKAPKDEHGTVITIKVPEHVNIEGEQKYVWFPEDVKEISFFRKPLLHDNVEIITTSPEMYLDEDDIAKLADAESELWGKGNVATIPVGKNFNISKYEKNTTAKFDWGTAELYIGKERKNSNWDINHTVLSSGIFQFNESFDIKQWEKIPFDVIVNVHPTVDASSPAYPFNVKREGWKETIREDIGALKSYIKNVALGIEAQETVNQFKNIKSLQLIDVGDIGTSNIDITEFITPKKKSKIKLAHTYTPTTVTVQGGKVIGKDAKGKEKIFAVSKDQEKVKSSFEAGKAVPSAKDFLIETGVDDSKPIFHNNTNVDYFDLARSHGLSAEEFFAELGSAMLKVKEAVSDASSYGYDSLTDKDQSFFFGISIDKGYHGVNTVVPFKAALLNPLAIKQTTLPGLAYGYYDTILHELAHIPQRNHDASFVSEMAKLHSTLASDGTDLELRVMLGRVLKKHQKLINILRGEFEKSTTKNLAKSLDKTEGDGGVAAGRIENGSKEGVDTRDGKRTEVSGTRREQTRNSRISNGGRASESAVAKHLLNDKGSVDPLMLFQLGETFYTGGKQTYFDWQKKMKAAVGDAWEKVKGYLDKIWKELKKPLAKNLEEGSITLSFQSKELKVPEEYLGKDFKPFELEKGEAQVNIGKEANKKIKIGVSDAERFVSLIPTKSRTAAVTPTDYMFDKYPQIRNLLDQAREVDKIITKEAEEFSKKLKVIEKKYSNKSKREKVGINWHYANKSGKEAMETLGHEKSDVSEYTGLRDEIQPLFTEILKKVNKVRIQLGKKPIKLSDDYLTFYAVENYMTDFINLTKGQDSNNIVLDDVGTIQARQGLSTKDSAAFAHVKREGLRDNVKLELDPLVILNRYSREALNHIHKSPLIAFTREMIKSDLHDPVTGKKISIGGNAKTAASSPTVAADISSWINKWAGKSNVNLPRSVERIGQKVMDNLTTAQLLGSLRTTIVQSAALVPTAVRFGYYNTFTGSMDALFTDKIGESKVPYEKSNSLPTASWDVAADNMGNAIGKSKAGKTFHAVKETSAFLMQGVDYLARKMTFGTAYRSVLPLVEAGKLTEKQAIRIADAEVIRTQGSGSITEISPIQRNVLGKMATLWQTHTINQANFFFRDVLGISGKKLSKGERAKRIFRTLFGVAMMTLIYEKIMGIQSPFPAPSSAVRQSIKEKDNPVQLTRKLLLELSEGLPFGGSVKFGSSILGPIADHAQDIVKAISGKGDFNQDLLTSAFSTNPKVRKRARIKIVELIGKTTGIPGTAQWAKYVRGRMRGESIPRAAVGRIYGKKEEQPAEGSLNAMRKPINTTRKTIKRKPINALRKQLIRKN